MVWDMDFWVLRKEGLGAWTPRLREEELGEEGLGTRNPGLGKEGLGA